MHRVQRAGADVPEHHTQRAESNAPNPAAPACFAVTREFAGHPRPNRARWPTTNRPCRPPSVCCLPSRSLHSPFGPDGLALCARASSPLTLGGRPVARPARRRRPTSRPAPRRGRRTRCCRPRRQPAAHRLPGQVVNIGYPAAARIRSLVQDLAKIDGTTQWSWPPSESLLPHRAHDQLLRQSQSQQLVHNQNGRSQTMRERPFCRSMRPISACRSPSRNSSRRCRGRGGLLCRHRRERLRRWC